ncbi:molybdopterin adenylyltransferase [bacterium BMS3Abin07]|nr:molybdopterin adenylyltransferase [bacterium BMS3Abin07]GBE32561.1 molybdopterin adenylyltransferase [bacterium BMS3Bbin05]HDO22544.1 MogA/MoaB family molybdenum cofactor biosynthesis protein [Nitrospirota bacterium]HDZ89017.1 MogA/MoaB family molybdenum cofactor biosynthesis protein [Nitrospirota bacterium]
MIEEKISVSILTMSDRGSKGERDDFSGRTVKESLDPTLYKVVEYDIIPDDSETIVSKLKDYSEKSDLILTTGGTGLSPRDFTPEATLKVIDREVPGIAEAMRNHSMQYTNRAMLSRAVAGVRKECLIINLPGSPKAAKENLEAILGTIPHAVEKIKGSKEECAR